MQLEEEQKKVKTIKKPVYTGPLVSLHSKSGISTLRFANFQEDPFGNFNAAQAAEMKDKIIQKNARPCPVTGLPAKFTDPVTKIRYHDLNAFKTIRSIFDDYGKQKAPNSQIDLAQFALYLTEQLHQRKFKKTN